MLLCEQPSARAQYPLVRIVEMYPDSSRVICNVTLRAPNTNLKYGDTNPNEKPVYHTYRQDSRKIALLESPKL